MSGVSTYQNLNRLVTRLRDDLNTSDDGQAHVQLRAEQGTVWLTQLEMAELFHTTKQNIAKHLKAIFVEQELSEEAVVNHWLTTQNKSHHFRGVTKMVELGNFRSVMP